MKVYPEKLEAIVRQGIAPVYIISGDEPLLVQESADLLRNLLKAAGFSERELMHVEGNFDWQQVLQSASSMSLFAEQKIIELRIPSGKPGDQGSKALLELVNQPMEGNVLLVLLPRMDQSSQRSKWFKALESAGVLVQVWPIDAKQMPRWLEQRFRRAGLKASRDAINVMSVRLEGNLLAAVQEIERLRLLAKDDVVDVELVTEGVADSARYDIFTLVDAALGGDSARTLRIARGLQAEGAELLFITNMLSRELRQLAQMSDEASRNGMDSALKKGRVWQKKKPLVTRCLKENSRDKLQALQARVARIDWMVKGLATGDPWDELASILAALCGVNSLPGSKIS